MSDDELMPSSQRSRHCTHPSASLTRHTRPHRSGAKCCPASDASCRAFVFSVFGFFQLFQQALSPRLGKISWT